MALNIQGLVEYRKGLEAAIDGAAEETANDVMDLASQLAPKDSGDLSQSGRVRQMKKGGYVVSFGNGLPDKRAIFQEYGTHDQPAQPYLRPAAQAIDPTARFRRRLKDLSR